MLKITLPVYEYVYHNSSYLVNIQSLHGIFDKLDVDLSLFWLKLLVRNKLGFCNKTSYYIT